MPLCDPELSSLTPPICSHLPMSPLMTVLALCVSMLPVLVLLSEFLNGLISSVTPSPVDAREHVEACRHILVFGTTERGAGRDSADAGEVGDLFTGFDKPFAALADAQAVDRFVVPAHTGAARVDAATDVAAVIIDATSAVVVTAADVDIGIVAFYLQVGVDTQRLEIALAAPGQPISAGIFAAASRTSIIASTCSCVFAEDRRNSLNPWPVITSPAPSIGPDYGHDFLGWSVVQLNDR